MTTGVGRPRPAGDAEQDARDDGAVLWTASGIVASAYALGSVFQATYIYAVVAPNLSSAGVWMRVVANVVAVVVLVGTLVLWRQHSRHAGGELAAGVAVAAVAMSVVRVLSQVATGVYPGFSVPTTPVEIGSGLVIGSVSAAAGTWAMQVRRGLRREARAAERSAVERALAVQALEDEETRVRREVAEGLHSSMQQRLVLLTVQAVTVAGRLRAAGVEEEAAAIDDIRAELERIRDEDVRGMSRMLYPDQVEIGLVPAVRALVCRVPTSIATRFDVAPALREADDPVSPTLAPTERLLAARVVEEGIANALRHGEPTRLAVALDLDGDLLTVSVEDDGRGLAPETAGHRSGTRRLSERFALVGGRIELTGSPGSGARLVGRLPVAGVSDAARAAADGGR